MLRKILTPEQCAQCRICCGFVDGDRWEIPLFAGEKERRIAEGFGAPIEAVPDTESCIFSMKFSGDEVVMCPAAGGKGCVLGADRPFDCMIWPFRVMNLNGIRVITVSPVCPEVIKLPLETLMDFINSDGFAEKLFSHARNYPETVKPYVSGYPILAADSK